MKFSFKFPFSECGQCQGCRSDCIKAGFFIAYPDLFLCYRAWKKEVYDESVRTKKEKELRKSCL